MEKSTYGESPPTINWSTAESCSEDGFNSGAGAAPIIMVYLSNMTAMSISGNFAKFDLMDGFTNKSNRSPEILMNG